MSIVAHSGAALGNIPPFFSPRWLSVSWDRFPNESLKLSLVSGSLLKIPDKDKAQTCPRLLLPGPGHTSNIQE